MKLVRFIFAIFVLLSLSAGLFAFQYARQFTWGQNIPSEFYWTRLQYTSSYAGGGSFGYRRFTA